MHNLLERLRREQSSDNFPKLTDDELAALQAIVKNMGRVKATPLQLKNRDPALDAELEWRRYLRCVLDYNVAIRQTGIPQDSNGKKPKRPRGRPSDTDKKEDAQIYAAWQTDEYQTYFQLAGTLSKPEADVRKAIDREEKRRAAKE